MRGILATQVCLYVARRFNKDELTNGLFQIERKLLTLESIFYKNYSSHICTSSRTKFYCHAVEYNSKPRA